jgi:hypothetical protein
VKNLETLRNLKKYKLLVLFRTKQVYNEKGHLIVCNGTLLLGHCTKKKIWTVLEEVNNNKFGQKWHYFLYNNLI